MSSYEDRMSKKYGFFSDKNKNSDEDHESEENTRVEN